MAIKKINRSKMGRGVEDLSKDIKEIDCDDFYIPTSGNCLLKCINKITGTDMQE